MAVDSKSSVSVPRLANGQRFDAECEQGKRHEEVDTDRDHNHSITTLQTVVVSQWSWSLSDCSPRILALMRASTAGTPSPFCNDEYRDDAIGSATSGGPRREI